METSNRNKTEPMDATDGNEQAKPFDKLRRVNDNKLGRLKVKIVENKCINFNFLELYLIF